MKDLYIGLMCGTSIDGVDVALVDFSDNQNTLIANYLHPIDLKIKNKLRSLCSLSCNENHVQNFEHRIELLGEMEHTMGLVFADSVKQLLTRENIPANDIQAIGSHGQTIRHQPTQNFPFTLQIGDPNIIAYQTGIITVSDFRRMDMAAGGQGAPLAPAFHNAALRSADENRIILNLGGIANITYLPLSPEDNVIGFDTGTANTLLDVWYMHNHPNSDDDFDRDSAFALQGKVHEQLLEKMLQDPYFELPYPKSTGREYFSFEWLQKHLQKFNKEISACDIQRTLLEFTAATIKSSVDLLNIDSLSVYTCGGGSHNSFLIERLEAFFQSPVKTTNSIGVDGDYLEAMTFAWLARQRLLKQPGNLPSVTGAQKSQILGAIYHP